MNGMEMNGIRFRSVQRFVDAIRHLGKITNQEAPGMDRVTRLARRGNAKQEIDRLDLADLPIHHLHIFVYNNIYIYIYMYVYIYICVCVLHSIS